MEFVDRYGFSATSQEKKALSNLARPIRLKPGRSVELTHPKYRGPWHLQTEQPDGEKVRQRIDIVPTSFALLSPDMLKTLEEREEGALSPYKAKPVILEKTNGFLVNVGIDDVSDNGSTVVSLRNLGKPISGEALLKIVSHEVWEDGILDDPKSILVSLPVGNTSTLRASDNIFLGLTSEILGKVRLSFTASTK